MAPLTRCLALAALLPMAAAISGAAGSAASRTEIDQQRLNRLSTLEQDLQSTEDEEASHLTKLNGQIVGLVRQRDSEKHSVAERKQDIAFVQGEVQRLQRRLRLKSSGTSAAAAAAAAAADASSQELRDAQAQAEQAEAQAEAQAAVQVAAQAKADAEAKLRAEAAARARAEAEAEAQARAKEEAEAEARAQEEAAARSQQQAQADAEARKHKDVSSNDADSAGDSFKQFMQEEDGEDQQGDADYEDSANALAGAIGWNRKEIESKADTAVKQLTEAIGGKRVVETVQHMVAGIR